MVRPVFAVQLSPHADEALFVGIVARVGAMTHSEVNEYQRTLEDAPKMRAILTSHYRLHGRVAGCDLCYQTRNMLERLARVAGGQ